jgi:hypothetical protein
MFALGEWRERKAALMRHGILASRQDSLAIDRRSGKQFRESGHSRSMTTDDSFIQDTLNADWITGGAHRAQSFVVLIHALPNMQQEADPQHQEFVNLAEGHRSSDVRFKNGSGYSDIVAYRHCHP